MSWTENRNEIIKRLMAGETLSVTQLAAMDDYFDLVHEEVGEISRWSVSVLAVYEVDGALFAMSYGRGLTGAQNNGYFSQPYRVRLVPELVERIGVIPC